MAGAACEFFAEPSVEVCAVPEPGEAVDLCALREHLEEEMGADCGTDPDSEFCDVEGLCDVVDCAEVEGGDFVVCAREP